MSEKQITVSVIMPVYNEGKYIKKCIDSLLKQDYPKEKMEWIFVDGNSKDDTINIINEYCANWPCLIRVLNNPKKIVPYGMNIGIAASRGKYIIRLDAHADYRKDYISKCVFNLENNNEADNVGGLAETKANGFIGQCIAKMLSSKFGVGNSAFRTNGDGGFVDTVPFGAFRREVFAKYGGYDERLVRNQDNELNYRIRRNGGKILLCTDIGFSYYCRDSIQGISKMALANGKWNVITMHLCPGSMSIRHFVPLFFVVSVCGLSVLGFICYRFWELLLAEVLLYSMLDMLFSVPQSSSIKEFVVLMILFPIFHISYGIGSINGIRALMQGQYKNHTYVPPKVI